MTRTRLVAMTIIALGFATGAFAQSVDATADYYRPSIQPRPVLRMDPLDPVSRVALLAAQSGALRSLPELPYDVIDSSAPRTTAPIAQRQPPTRIVTENESSAPSNFFNVLNQISAGVQVGHEGLDLYEHSIKANAMRNFYNGR